MKSHWQVILIFEAFMLAVQLVLLNLLIAIMTETHGRLRTVSKLVAHFERAKHPPWGGAPARPGDPVSARTAHRRRHAGRGYTSTPLHRRSTCTHEPRLPRRSMSQT